jgi:Ca2+-binding EF-hand superfamily protein
MPTLRQPQHCPNFGPTVSVLWLQELVSHKFLFGRFVKNKTSKMPPKGSKKAKKSGSNIFAMFSQKQIQEFKEAFGIIDVDKDGIITAGDLQQAFQAIGRSVSDGEIQGMLGEAPGPVNFTQLVTLFAEKMAGGTDDDDVILKSFEAFEINGQIDAEMFRHSLMTWGEKFSATEIDDAFGEFNIDGGMIDAVHLKSLMVAKKEGEDA